MTSGEFRKVGWTWTARGWKRIPRRLRQVKKVPLPPTRKTRKKQGVAGASPREKPPTFAEARKLAVEKGRADSAPTPAPEIAPRMTPPNRRAWNGKYDDLAKPIERSHEQVAGLRQGAELPAMPQKRDCGLSYR
jgi:hypothetical protein